MSPVNVRPLTELELRELEVRYEGGDETSDIVRLLATHLRLLAQHERARATADELRAQAGDLAAGAEVLRARLGTP